MFLDLLREYLHLTIILPPHRNTDLDQARAGSGGIAVLRGTAPEAGLPYGVGPLDRQEHGALGIELWVVANSALHPDQRSCLL